MGPIVRLNVKVGSSGQVVSICLGSAPSSTRAPCPLGSVVAEAPPAYWLFVSVVSLFLFFFYSCWFLCISAANCCVISLSDRKELSWSSCLAGTTSAVSMTCSWLSRCSDQVHSYQKTHRVLFAVIDSITFL